MTKTNCTQEQYFRLGLNQKENDFSKKKHTDLPLLLNEIKKQKNWNSN